VEEYIVGDIYADKRVEPRIYNEVAPIADAA